VRFEGRDLKPFAEPVAESTLEEGTVHFSVNFVDDEMLVPTLEPVVFVGRNLGQSDTDRLYFQDVDSFRRGVRYLQSGNDDDGTFYVGPGTQVSHIFEFERALGVLMHCSIRRARHK